MWAQGCTRDGMGRSCAGGVCPHRPPASLEVALWGWLWDAFRVTTTGDVTTCCQEPLHPAVPAVPAPADGAGDKKWLCECCHCPNKANKIQPQVALRLI